MTILIDERRSVMKNLFLIVLGSLFAVSNLGAQSEIPETILTAPPSATVGTYIMHPHAVNLESGISFTNTNTDTFVDDYSEDFRNSVLLNIGLSYRLL